MGAKRKTVDQVAGVRLEVVDQQVLAKYLRHCKLDDGGALPERVGRLVAHMRKATPDSRLAECNTCGGESDVQLPVCPYCGDGEVAGEDGVVQQQAPAVVQAQAGTVEESDVEQVEPAEAGGGEEMMAQLVRMPRKKGRAAQEQVPAPVAEPVAELEEAVAEVLRLKREAVVSYWDIGQQLWRVHKDKLYLQARDPEGRPVYPSWTAFVTQAVQISTVHSYQLMAVATSFRREDVEEIGATKLKLILSLPAGDRDKLLQDARAGASRSKLAEEVRRLAGWVPEAAAPEEDAHGPAAAAPGKSKPKGVTVALVMGRQTVPLFVRPAKRADEPKRATKVAEDPHGRLELANGVVQVFKLATDRNGKLVLIVETRRDA